MNMGKMIARTTGLLAVMASLGVAPLFAHPGHVEAGGAAGGFLHLHGADVVLLAVAVALLALVGSRGLVRLPAAFRELLARFGGLPRL